MSSTTTYIVAALYILAGILGLIGILFTVSVFQRDNVACQGDGTTVLP